jgi:hypothetical protein
MLVDANDLSPKEAMVIAVLNGSGKLVMESIVETKASSILQFIHGLQGELHVTWEEGTYTPQAWLPSRTSSGSDMSSAIFDLFSPGVISPRAPDCYHETSNSGAEFPDLGAPRSSNGRIHNP